MAITNFDPATAEEISPGVCRTAIDGLFYLPREAFNDERGFYAEIARLPEIDAVTDDSFQLKQINLSRSNTHVMRGIHAENWNKLLTVIEGTAFCAWVDLRPESATFGDVTTMKVGNGNDSHFGSMYVAAGIGNSFCVLNGPLYYLYAVDQLYQGRDQSGDVAIALFDEDLAINWPIGADQAIISERDQQAVTLRSKFPEKFS